jgi:microcystin degradation protein MlrC
MSHEANTFSPQLVDAAFFEATGVLRGAEIRDRHQHGTTTVSGFLSAARRHGVEVVPLVMTTLVPSGPITADALRLHARDLVGALADHGPYDGVLASLHGAAVSEQILDVDGYLLRCFREVVGPGVPVGVSLDLHANISAEMCAHSDVLNTYRTNPHVDAAEVAEEVAGLIIRSARGEVRPTQWCVPIPAAINILCQNTDESPMSEVISDVREMMTRPGVLSATVAEGYPYADVPEMGMAAVVVTDNNPPAARRHANDLARRVWERRDGFDLAAPSPAEAIRRASRTPETPVLLLDVGDNIGAGSPGDSVSLLNAARDAGFRDLLTVIADPESAAACTAAGPGGVVDLTIGARTDPVTGPPVQSSVTVLSLHHGTFEATEPVHAGMSTFQAGPSAAVRLDSGQTVILTSIPVMPLSTAQLTTLGLSVSEFAAIVAKGAHSPLAGYGPHVASTIRVDTPGITAANLRGFTYQHRRTPMFPFEPDAGL